jgi:hypothetical protein
MPWTPAQHRLFEAAAHNQSVATRSGIPQQTAQKMAKEGAKSDPKKLAEALRGK